MQATIHNEFLTLTVDTHGAEAISLKNAAGEELLWQADPAIWKRHAPILFPWTGKLVDGTFTAKGKTWKGGQHGFARDLEHTLLRAEGDTIQLELRADDAIKAERFPYDFVLTSTFRLEGKTVHHTLQVTNPGTEELRFGIGFHPAFIGICEKGTGRNITCRVEGYPYSLIWSAPAKPVRFVCIEPWHSLPAAVTDPQDWEQRAAAACLAPGESWQTTLSTTFER